MVLAVAPKTLPKRPPRPLKPFTIRHFRAWARELELDSGKSWHLEPFQEAFAEDLFAGSPENWLVVPEGNGKTTLVAGLALYHCEFQPFAAVPIAASSREQAEIMYRQAEGFVLRSERLHQTVHSLVAVAKGKGKTEVPRFLCLEGYRRINHHGGGRIQVFAADDRTGDGVIPTLGIIDELHRHRDLALYRTWVGKLQKRKGQIATISTAGEPGSEFELTRERIRQAAQDITRTGSHLRARTSRLVLHEWAVPETGDVDDMTVVKAANPFSGITVDTLAEKRSSPTMTLGHWRRFVCNLPTRSDEAAITEAEWEAARSDEQIPEGEPVAVGLDVAWKYDTTALVPFWMDSPEHRLLGPAVVLVPPRDGNTLDPGLIERAIRDIHERNPIHTVVMDPSKAEQLGHWIEEEIGAVVIEHKQTNVTAVADYNAFMEGLRMGWLKHSGDVGLTSHALNAVAKVLPFGDTKFERPSQTRLGSEQDRRVIDALVAAAMVHQNAVSFAPIEEDEFAWA